MDAIDYIFDSVGNFIYLIAVICFVKVFIRIIICSVAVNTGT